jgi:hypothetical protein
VANPTGIANGKIIHWQVGDVIDLLNTKVTAVEEDTGRLYVQGTGFRPMQIAFADQQFDTKVAFQSDGHGGTDLILTPMVGVASLHTEFSHIG